MTSPWRQAAGPCLALALLAAPAAAGDKRPANPASHEPAFFEALLVGRANVYAKPYNRGETWDESGRVAGMFLRRDGKVFSCTRQQGATKSYAVNWRMLPSEKHRTILSLYFDDADPADPRNHVVPFYDGEGGRQHFETWWASRRQWVKYSEGWVQESWPRALADLCPDLVEQLPAGMAINEAQTENWIGRLRKQDPGAVLARFPGWESGSPEAKGRGVKPR